MKSIERLGLGDVGYAQVKEAIRRQKSNRIDYDRIAEQYNMSCVNGLVLVKVRRTTSLGNMVKVLHGRGLIRYIDFDITRQKLTATGKEIPVGSRPVVITKLTETIMN